MGATLKSFLSQFSNLFGKGEFGCSYVIPPLGNYMGHQSTTDKQGKFLDPHWGEFWIQGGTRQCPELGWTRSRSINKLVGLYKAVELVKVFPEHCAHKYWRTQPPANMHNEFMGLQPWHRANVHHEEACLCAE